jgi:hypothetical protein
MPAGRFAAWAGNRTECEVSGVTSVTDILNASISAALGAVAEVTLAAESKVTRVTALGVGAGEVTRVTQPLTPGLSRKPINDHSSNPSSRSNPQKKECPASLNVAADPAWWHDFFEERAAIREIDGGRSREDAERLAFDDVILKWHHHHGAHSDPRRCAGCGVKLVGEADLVLSDGARVHLDAARGVNCVITYGQKWRGAAVAALRALGLDPPKGFSLL